MKPKTKRASGKKVRKGSALLLATILLFAILTVIISLSSVTVMEMKMSQKGKSSVVSFYSAESGVEWALNKIASSSGNLSGAFPLPATDGSVDCPDALGADCKVYFLNESGNVIPAANFGSTEFSEVRAVRSIGSQGNETQRAIEAATAAPGGGASFTYYCNFSGGSATTNICTDAGGDQKYCPLGFRQIYDLGAWGYCRTGVNYIYSYSFYVPPGGGCSGGWDVINSGNAYVCSE